MSKTIAKIIITMAAAAMITESAFAQVPEQSDFACDLYTALSHEQGNIFFSPISISTALAMTYAGARGETAREMATVLHFGPDAQLVHSQNKFLLGSLSTNDEDPYQIAIANRLWPDLSLDLKQEFLDLTAQYYQAAPEAMDFSGQPDQSRQIINRWVLDNTNGMIVDLLHKEDIGFDTRMVLTNAIYFKAGWLSPFDKGLTTSGDFQLGGGKTAQVDFMNRTGNFALAALEDATLLQLPYDGGNFAFAVVLPHQVDGLAKLEAQLSPEVLNSWLGQLVEQPASVTLPRFELTCREKLRDVLVKLGMPSAFGGGADFSGMTDGKIFIDNVIHQARIKVNEEGTEAAAATAVTMRKSMPVRFQADHPFLFLIRDTASGAILFMGRLADPTG